MYLFIVDRKSSTSSFDQFRLKGVDAGSGSWSIRGSLERREAGGTRDKRDSWSSACDEMGITLDTFRSVTLTFSSLFKQVRILFLLFHKIQLLLRPFWPVNT